MLTAARCDIKYVGFYHFRRHRNSDEKKKLCVEMQKITRFPVTVDVT